MVPTGTGSLVRNTTYFRASPHCTLDYSFPPTFTACQARTWEKEQVTFGFSLSPSMKSYFYNKANEKYTIGSGWSWYQWLLSNEPGATADVSALAQLRPITTWLLNVTGTISEQAKLGRRLHYIQKEELSNHTPPEAAVYLPSPFVFLLTNITSGSEVDSKNASVECFLSKY